MLFLKTKEMGCVMSLFGQFDFDKYNTDCFKFVRLDEMDVIIELKLKSANREGVIRCHYDPTRGNVHIRSYIPTKNKKMVILYKKLIQGIIHYIMTDSPISAEIAEKGGEIHLYEEFYYHWVHQCFELMDRVFEKIDKISERWFDFVYENKWMKLYFRFNWIIFLIIVILTFTDLSWAKNILVFNIVLPVINILAMGFFYSNGRYMRSEEFEKCKKIIKEASIIIGVTFGYALFVALIKLL